MERKNAKFTLPAPHSGFHMNNLEPIDAGGESTGQGSAHLDVGIHEFLLGPARISAGLVRAGTMFEHGQIRWYNRDHDRKPLQNSIDDAPVGAKVRTVVQTPLTCTLARLLAGLYAVDTCLAKSFSNRTKHFGRALRQITA